MSFITHSARKLDADGVVDNFWLAGSGDTISAVGTGDDWLECSRRAGIADEDVQDGHGMWLVPGFIDLHSHGGGGFSYDHGLEEMRNALAMHRTHGTTRSVISLVANPIGPLCTLLAAVAALVVVDPLVVGSHLEGPFLASTRRGAHDPAHLIDPHPAAIDALLDAANGSMCQVTLAPELPGALEAVDAFTAAGVTVALGHTEAEYRLVRAAFDRGARVLTHAFNAMPGIRPRQPGPVIAAFQDDRVTLELILDGQHVHPDVAHMAFRSAPDRIALVTDAMAAAGSVDGDYRLGDMDVTVHGGRAVLAGTETIAGSTLTQDVALRIAIQELRLDPVAAVAALTAVPARALGLQHLGCLRPGFAADTVLLDADWQVQSVRAAGVLLGR